MNVTVYYNNVILSIVTAFYIQTSFVYLDYAVLNVLK